MNEEFIRNVQENTQRQRELTEQLKRLSNQLRQASNRKDKEMIGAEIERIRTALRKTNRTSAESARKISIYKQLPTPQPGGGFQRFPDVTEQGASPSKTFQPRHHSLEDRRSASAYDSNKGKKKEEKDKFKLNALEKRTIKRIKKPGKEKRKDTLNKGYRNPNKFVQIASKMFYDFSLSLIKKNRFKKIRRELIRSNLEFVPANYLSFMFFITLISFFVSLFVFGFFLFFSIVALPPFLIRTETPFLTRLLQTFWIPILLPIVTYVFMYFYPSAERKALETRINHELPFATIHMSSISSSLVEPSKIFSIIVTTKEYPNISKEFTKLLNELNIYGYDLVSALRSMAFNSPSKKLAELFNGLATTITSGGDLPEFFDKRSQTLLLEYRLEREKQGKAAETFMDIYISVVIAAPMILMLLLVMMRISGLGVSISTSMITLIMALAVTLINILFLTFLHLKQPEGGSGG